MVTAVIRKFSHHFCVVSSNRLIQQPIFDYYRNRLSTFKFGHGRQKGKREIDKTFASANKERTHFRMLNACYDDFIRYMAGRGIAEDTWEVEEVRMYVPTPVEFKCTFPHPLRPKQVEIEKFICQSPIKPYLPNMFFHPQRVIPLQMGGGKTLIALYVAAQLGVRTMIEVSKRYRENWVSNVCGDDAKLDVELSDVLIIQSHTDLVRAIRKACSKHEKFDYKIIIAHKSTISNFVNAYVRGEPEFKQYGIKVEDLYKVLGVGLLIRDEVHEELHANAKQDLHRHVPLVINLSATLEFDDPKVDEMCKLVFPFDTRFNAGEWNKYIDVFAVRYGLQFPTKLKWYQYKNGPYNQAEFEKSILASKEKFQLYADFICNLIVENFQLIYEPGDKLAVYAHTINMCTKLQEYIEDRFTEYSVNRYVGEDVYEDLISADIVVTTPGSAGTGQDIKGLRRVLMTNAIKSSQKNFQVAGRLRELFELDSKGVVRDVVFLYLVCNDIPQQVDYHFFKRSKFRGKMKSQNEIETGFYL